MVCACILSTSTVVLHQDQVVTVPDCTYSVHVLEARTCQLCYSLLLCNHCCKYTMMELELSRYVPYSRKLSREKTFVNSVAIRENFLREIWGCGVLWGSKTEQSVRVLSAKIILFTNLWMFSPSKVSRYTVVWSKRCTIRINLPTTMKVRDPSSYSTQ